MSQGYAERLESAVEAAERWAIFDPDPTMRGRIDRLVDTRDDALIALFEGRIGFGTAGLRAEVGPGPNRMNALVVRQTSWAVVEHLRQSGVAVPRVVIGYDARYDSAAFAQHTAAAVTAAGGEALLGDRPAPTPIFAHALLAEGADAAVVITASHNPAADNGYKLYLGDGLQLVSPADAEIADRIDVLATHWHAHAAEVDDAFREALDTPDGVPTHEVDQWEAAHRQDAVAALLTDKRSVTVAYTPMHGVGGLAITRAFAEAGFAEPLIVEEQFEPDPSFPTVSFPNPEEPGAFDAVMAVAEHEGADAAFANDPDADRLAIAVPSRDGDGFRPLSGNELGVLFADHILTNTTGTNRMVARSIVSSRQLDVMAEASGVLCHVVLTGFKWVARPMLTSPDHRYVFGYEEAIGYCIGRHVRDKDGVTAALLAAEMLAGFADRGVTAWDRLDELATQYGLFLNRPLTQRFDGEPSQAAGLVDRIVESPPQRLGDVDIARLGPIGWGELPPTPGVQLLTTDQTQVIIRPSGTEPKVKAYIEVVEPVTTDLASARAVAEVRLEAAAVAVRALLGAPGA